MEEFECFCSLDWLDWLLPIHSCATSCTNFGVKFDHFVLILLTHLFLLFQIILQKINLRIVSLHKCLNLLRFLRRCLLFTGSSGGGNYGWLNWRGPRRQIHSKLEALELRLVHILYKLRFFKLAET